MAMNCSKPGSIVLVAGLAVVLAMALATALPAQQTGSQPAAGATRTVLERHDLSVPGYEGVLARTELAPGAREPRHTHPGDIFVYVQEGTLSLVVDGKPSTTAKAGDVFFVPAGQIHSGENNGNVPVKLLVSFFVVKGKPLTSPVK